MIQCISVFVIHAHPPQKLQSAVGSTLELHAYDTCLTALITFLLAGLSIGVYTYIILLCSGFT